ncbi:39S ribosomal protein L3, mitochondrial-like [Anneissia japonica]|uniref:39S ribosomal protein L3, mitochondrial-like n=1 Tax=Anneissia japonica TaxID=1529436 RepID=UPI001425B297|nr:39S ribosomal protein L3, mitochondrial-like [Anneissia japonica]
MAASVSVMLLSSRSYSFLKCLPNYILRIQCASKDAKNSPDYYLATRRLDTTIYENDVTEENEEFLKEWNLKKHKFDTSPLKEPPWEKGVWTPKSKRTGLVGMKLGMVRQWTKDGEQVAATVVQILENEVLKYESPAEYKYSHRRANYGAIIVGAKNIPPDSRDRTYLDLFKGTGIPVKDFLATFTVSENSKLQPGTPLFAAHFKPGMKVDICGKTRAKGFQGVMKRWGFSGQPASHGATKTHRRIGGVGGGGSPGRVWPGKKMPGMMGDRWRWKYNLQILRINTKHNLLYIIGSLPGFMYDFLKIKDSDLTLLTSAPPFPTFSPDLDNPLPEDLYADHIFQFSDESIKYEEEEEREEVI